MIYLLDANVLITAHNSYYNIERVGEFWEWLLHQANSNNVKMPIEIIEEVLEGREKDDILLDWMKENKKTFLLDEEVDGKILQRVIDEGYATDLTDDELETIGRDPFLVAYALALPERCIVTTEAAAPSKKRQNRRLPDVCNTFSISCKNTFNLNQELNFRTTWKESI